MEGGDSSHTPAPARDPGLRIFVCYRREDSAGFARALKTVLGERYGNDRVFMDLDNIAPGELWEDVVDRAVSSCDVLIALIGTQWLRMTDASGRPRLADPVDPVRLEIEAALKQRLTIIPTLLQGAHMPPGDKLPPAIDSLPAIQALSITDDWDAGVSKLVATLDRIDERKAGVRPDGDGRAAGVVAPPPTNPSPARSPDPTPRHVSRSLVVGVVAAAVVIGGVLYATLHRDPSSTAATSTMSLHDYLWAAHDLVQSSAEQRSQVQAAISDRDADALRNLQQGRTDLLATVQAWDVPPEAKAATLALETALHTSAISDGNWASYADGDLSVDDARSYDAETVHPAKFAFDRSYNELLNGIDDAPPALPSDFLF